MATPKKPKKVKLPVPPSPRDFSGSGRPSKKSTGAHTTTTPPDGKDVWPGGGFSGAR
jgi:hypothetical protein